MNTTPNVKKLGYQVGTIARKLRALSGYPVNHKLIQVYGLQRSGNHGIINWITAQGSSKVCHINGVFPGINPWQKNWGVSYQRFDYWPSQRDASGAFVRKNMLLCSYENRELADALAQDRGTFAKYVGHSRSTYAVLILRDPYNTFASWLKSGWDVTPAIVQLWKDYAKEFLDITHTLPQDKVLINFNRWFQDQDYRRQLSQQLGLPFSDEGLEQVSHNGGGSSFDQQAFKGKAKQMKLLERFQSFIEDKRFIELFQDKEIGQLSDKIFGPIPGTEMLNMERVRVDP